MNDPTIAAFLNFGSGRKVSVTFLDYPEEWHENDNGLNVFLRLLRRVPQRKVDRDDRFDPSVLYTVSWRELFDRVNAELNRQGINIDLPNGLSKEVIRALGQQDDFRKAAKRVLNEIARSQGLGDNISKYLSEFPFDAFYDDA
jgi:hypothetical protein